MKTLLCVGVCALSLTAWANESERTFLNNMVEKAIAGEDFAKGARCLGVPLNKMQERYRQTVDECYRKVGGMRTADEGDAFGQCLTPTLAAKVNRSVDQLLACDPDQQANASDPRVNELRKQVAALTKEVDRLYAESDSYNEKPELSAADEERMLALEDEIADKQIQLEDLQIELDDAEAGDVEDFDADATAESVRESLEAMARAQGRELTREELEMIDRLEQQIRQAGNP